MGIHMPEKHQIVFYPVGNGDTSQVVPSQGRRVVFDFCHRKRGQKKWADAMHYTRNASLLRAEVLRDGHDSAVLVCESHAGKALLEDAGCTAKLDQYHRSNGGTNRCEFTINIKKACVP